MLNLYAHENNYRALTLSYSKFNKEMSQYLKMHQMMHSATADESVEQTELRLTHYHLAKDTIFKQWLEFEKFKALISCAHGRWYPYEEFTLPLAQYFSEQNDLAHLTFLCEQEIRFQIEDTLNCLKCVKEYDSTLTNAQILGFDEVIRTLKNIIQF